MRILYFDFDDIQNPLLGAGQGRATSFVGSRLVSLGHSVTVICSRYPGSSDRVENGIRYQHIGLGSRWIRLNNLAYLLAAPLYALTLARKAADVIIECATAPTSLLGLPLITKIPVVILPSMFNAHEFAQRYKLPFHWVEAFFAQFYRFALPYSENDSKKIQKLQPKIQMQITPQGVGEEFFTIPEGSNSYFLFLSRLDTWQKGLDLLLTAYSQIDPQGRLPLVIAGHGPDEAAVQKQIETLGLQKDVKMVGGAYGQKKADLMKDALAVVFPSRHDEMCLWTLEALAGGLPLVAFDLPESAWIPDTVALKVPSFDTTAFANAMTALQDEATNSHMRTAARTFARNFSWDHVAQMTASFLKKVVEESA